MELLSERKRWLILAGAAAGAVLLAAGLFFTRPWDSAGSDEPEIKVSSGTFSGSLDAVLKAEGLGDAERHNISKALSRKLDLRRLHPEDSYELVFSTWGPLRSLAITKALQYYSLSALHGGGYEVSVEAVELKPASGKAAGEIKASLWESMSAGGVPPGVILDYDEKGDLVSLEILDASRRVTETRKIEFEAVESPKTLQR